MKNKCHSSLFPLANYSVSLHQGEAFLCLPCPSTGITLWLPGVPSFSWQRPSWSEHSVAVDNTWPPRRANCLWPITALRSASSTLTGPPVWPPPGWSQSWRWGWTAGTDTVPSAKSEALISCTVFVRGRRRPAMAVRVVAQQDRRTLTCFSLQPPAVMMTTKTLS